MLLLLLMMMMMTTTTTTMMMRYSIFIYGIVRCVFRTVAIVIKFSYLLTSIPLWCCGLRLCLAYAVFIRVLSVKG